jgi:hypothetical protein
VVLQGDLGITKTRDILADIMAITGAHTLLYSSEPEALRNTLRDAFGFKSVDAGGGWLIFALPPAEVGVHPQDGPIRHQMSLMCERHHHHHCRASR